MKEKTCLKRQRKGRVEEDEKATQVDHICKKKPRMFLKADNSLNYLRRTIKKFKKHKRWRGHQNEEDEEVKKTSWLRQMKRRISEEYGTFIVVNYHSFSQWHHKE